MKAVLSYLDAAERPAESLAGHLLRVAAIVANCWTVLASGLLFFTMGSTSALHERLRIVALGALCIAAGMFSLILPFHYVVKRYAKEHHGS